MVPEIITGTSMPRASRDFGDGVDRRLGVERVEDGLDQQEVGAALEQPVDLLAIGAAQLVEGDGAEARDCVTSGEIEAVRLVGPSAPATKRGRPSSPRAMIGGRARELRALEVEFVGDVRHAVVGLRDRGRGERVGRDDVGAGAEIGEMDVADRVGLA